jgi:hypothetical protein
MRRRQILSKLNSRDNRASVPSGAGSEPAAVSLQSPPPVSTLTREEEDAAAQIWHPYPPKSLEGIPEGAELECCLDTATDEITYRVLPHVAINLDQFMTPATDPTANAIKKRGWPKGKKRGPKNAN